MVEKGVPIAFTVSFILVCQFKHPSSQFTSHPANKLTTNSNNSWFVNVVTASILVEWCFWMEVYMEVATQWPGKLTYAEVIRRLVRMSFLRFNHHREYQVADAIGTLFSERSTDFPSYLRFPLMAARRYEQLWMRIYMFVILIVLRLTRIVISNTRSLFTTCA